MLGWWLDNVLQRALQLQNQQIFARQLLERLDQLLAAPASAMPQTGLQHNVQVAQAAEAAQSAEAKGKKTSSQMASKPERFVLA